MRPPPCGGFGRLSCGSAVLRGCSRVDPGRICGSARPARRSSPSRLSTDAPSSGLRRRRPSMDFHSASELDHRDPAPYQPVARRTGRRFLSWTPSALRHMPARRIRWPTADPSAAAYHVRGLVTPCAMSTTWPAGVSSTPERPWASPFKDFPSSRSVLLSEPMPSCRCRPHRTLPEGDAYDLVAFRASFPRRVRAVAGTSRGSGRRFLLGVQPSRACSRSSWRAL